MANEPAPKEPLVPRYPPRDPTRRKRIGAATVGSIGVSVGGTGIFLSDNQAGTMTILLLGALFMLLAVQGTAILKVGREGAELERRAAGRVITNQAVDAVEKQKPEQAAELMEVAERVDSAIASDPAYGYLNSVIHELRAFDAVSKSIRELAQNGEIDLPGGSARTFESRRDAESGAGRDGIVSLPGRGNLLIDTHAVRQGDKSSKPRTAATVIDRMVQNLDAAPADKGWW